MNEFLAPWTGQLFELGVLLSSAEFSFIRNMTELRLTGQGLAIWLSLTEFNFLGSYALESSVSYA